MWGENRTPVMPAVAPSAFEVTLVVPRGDVGALAREEQAVTLLLHHPPVEQLSEVKAHGHEPFPVALLDDGVVEVKWIGLVSEASSATGGGETLEA